MIKKIQTIKMIIKNILELIAKKYTTIRLNFTTHNTINKKNIIKSRKANIFIDKKIIKKLKNISIIVPMYNAEKFIDILLSSLINQKTKYKYEIILVNDGSKDNTLNMIKKYEKQNKKITIIDKKNGGLSSARNAGINIAQGKYITFVDADDYISLDYVETMLNLAYKYDADIVKCGIIDKCNRKIINRHSNKDKVIIGKMGINLLNYDGYAWNKVYKAELFDNICYPEGYWYEDIITRTLLFRKANIFVNTSKKLYYRTFHKDQLTKVQARKSNKCLEQLYLVEMIIDSNKKLKLEEDLYFYLCILTECSSIMVHRMKLLDDDIKQQVFLRVYEIISSLYKEEYRKEMNKELKLKTDIILKKRYDLWLLEKYF